MGDNVTSVAILIPPGAPVTSFFPLEALGGGVFQLHWVTEGPSATVVFAEDHWIFSDSYPNGGVITVPANGTSSSLTISSTIASGSYSYEVTCAGKTASCTLKVENS